MFVFLAILAADFFYEKDQPIKADSSSNVSGFIWSENIGWLSLSNSSGGGSRDYGVNIDQATGQFSGYGWSENIGWIKFNPVGPYPSLPDHSAKLEGNQVTGWIRACAGSVNGDCTGGVGAGNNAGGWDGWIKMSGQNYGVTRSGCQLQGYAWGSDVVGWLKFAGTNYGAILAGSACENLPPTAGDLGVTSDPCIYGAGGILNWQFNDPNPDDSQSAYRIQIDNNPDFSSPFLTADGTTAESYGIVAGSLSYGQNYYWQVKVWDSHNLDSVWSIGPNIVTPVHAWPAASFVCSPSNPGTDEVVECLDTSTVYGGTTKAQWQWAMPADAVYEPGYSDHSQNPKVKFSSAGTKNITLRVWDSDGFNCSQASVLDVKQTAKWKEIIPQ